MLPHFAELPGSDALPPFQNDYRSPSKTSNRSKSGSWNAFLGHQIRFWSPPARPRKSLDLGKYWSNFVCFSMPLFIYLVRLRCLAFHFPVEKEQERQWEKCVVWSFLSCLLMVFHWPQAFVATPLSSRNKMGWGMALRQCHNLTSSANLEVTWILEHHTDAVTLLPCSLRRDIAALL